MKKRLGDAWTDSEQGWESLAKIVASEAHQVRIPLRTLTFDQLRQRHSPFVYGSGCFLTQPRKRSLKAARTSSILT